MYENEKINEKISKDSSTGTIKVYDSIDLSDPSIETY
jgi:hypothetical protein